MKDKRRKNNKVSSIQSLIEKRNRELNNEDHLSNHVNNNDLSTDDDQLYKIKKQTDESNQEQENENNSTDKQKTESQIKDSESLEQNTSSDPSHKSIGKKAKNDYSHDSEKLEKRRTLSTQSEEPTHKFTVKDRLKEFNDNRKRRKREKDARFDHLSPQERKEQLRIQRRKRQKRVQYIILTVLILLIILFLLYMFTPLSRISNIKISGNNNVTDSQVKKALDVKDNSRMYTYSKRKGIQNLKKNDLIKDVKIKKQLPNTLKVQITENQVVGVVKEKNKYVPIIEGNEELKNFDGKIAGSGPIINGFKGKEKDNMIKALSKMSPEVRDMISEVSYAPKQNSPNRILLYMQDDMQVVGNIKTIANKIKYYPQMSQSLAKDDSGNLKTQGYIDLSVGASFIPYNENSSGDSKSDQNVRQKSQQETDAKDELQSALNKINEQSDSNN
ncbi:FtsQ-type POTRA domain-containing protein [Staphylococcus sp. GDX8P80P]|uniref:cell division protein FtsQ/DivIB n=1 Tax=Staphylococcus sp. GDX8P80P TaxID=2804104 RepID=UPI001AEC09C0